MIFFFLCFPFSNTTVIFLNSFSFSVSLPHFPSFPFSSPSIQHLFLSFYLPFLSFLTFPSIQHFLLSLLPSIPLTFPSPHPFLISFSYAFLPSFPFSPPLFLFSLPSLSPFFPLSITLFSFPLVSQASPPSATSCNTPTCMTPYPFLLISVCLLLLRLVLFTLVVEAVDGRSRMFGYVRGGRGELRCGVWVKFRREKERWERKGKRRG